jgi:hypothetical protein
VVHFDLKNDEKIDFEIVDDFLYWHMPKSMQLSRTKLFCPDRYPESVKTKISSI